MDLMLSKTKHKFIINNFPFLTDYCLLYKQCGKGMHNKIKLRSTPRKSHVRNFNKIIITNQLNTYNHNTILNNINGLKINF